MSYKKIIYNINLMMLQNTKLSTKLKLQREFYNTQIKKKEDTYRLYNKKIAYNTVSINFFSGEIVDYMFINIAVRLDLIDYMK